MIIDKIKKRQSIPSSKKANVDIPVGKWTKCEKCKSIIYKEELKDNLSICPYCGNYFKLHINKRLEQILDKDSYKRFEYDLETNNPLELEGYIHKIELLRQKTNILEAVSIGTGKINGEELVICVMDSGFLMGSMGTVVGEKITYAMEQAIKLKLPIVIFTASGGARMQEGILSLMQMAKTTEAVSKLNEAGILYISVYRS